MPHSHDHDHDLEHISDRRLFWLVALNLGLTAAQLLIGLLSRSLSLVADAVHNFSDAAALLIAFVARKIARKKPDEAFTFGYRRAELIAALINLTVLCVVGLYLIYESLLRFLHPEPIEALWVIIAALIALLVDIITAALLWSMSTGNLNLRAAFLHNLTDAAVSLAVLLGAVVIHFYELTWIDPLLTLLIAAYILSMSLSMLKQSATILMEAAPLKLDLEALRAHIKAHPAVLDLHHLHVWDLDEEHRALEAHIVLHNDMPLSEAARILAALKDLLRQKFHIPHATLELEWHQTPCLEFCVTHQHEHEHEHGGG